MAGKHGKALNWRTLRSKLREAKLTPSLHIYQDPHCLVFISTENMRTCIYIDYEEICQEELFDTDLEIGSREGSKTVGWIFFSVGWIPHPLTLRRDRIINFSHSLCNMQHFLILKNFRLLHDQNTAAGRNLTRLPSVCDG